MRAIDIYNFRRDLNTFNPINNEIRYNVILELLDLRNVIDSIISEWVKINLDKIKHEN